jgi:hypothetical protein
VRYGHFIRFLPEIAINFAMSQESLMEVIFGYKFDIVHIDFLPHLLKALLATNLLKVCVDERYLVINSLSIFVDFTGNFVRDV